MRVSTSRATASRSSVRDSSRFTASRSGPSSNVARYTSAPIDLPSGNAVATGGPDDEGEETT